MLPPQLFNNQLPSVCQFPVLDAQQLTPQAVRGLTHPVLVKNAFENLEERFSKRALTKLYGNGSIELREEENARDRFEVPWRSGRTTTLASWVASLTRTPSQAFVFLFHGTTTGKMFSDGYLTIPEMMREVSLHRIFTAGTDHESGVAPFHAHEPGWLSVLTGRKIWLLGSPGNWSRFRHYQDTLQPLEVLSKVRGVMRCDQEAGDTIYVPDGWFHSTYNAGPWTVSVAGEGIVEGRFHADACLGKQELMQKATIEELKGDTDSNFRNPLHIAAWSGYSDVMIDFLVDRGLDVNLPDKDKMTPLHYAVNNFEHIVVALLRRRAAADALDQHHRQPLHYVYSISDSSMRIPELLREHGGNPFAVDRFGERPIHHMARCGNRKVVDWLLSLGEQPDVVNEFSMVTPFHYAIRYEHVDVLRSLLKSVTNKPLLMAMLALTQGRSALLQGLVGARLLQIA